MTTSRLRIELEDGVFFLAGIIDELSEFDQITNSKLSKIVLDLKGIERITSYGVKGWITMLNSLLQKELVYRNCPVTFIEQMNLVPGFKGQAVVESFEVPFFCSSCNDEFAITVHTDKIEQISFLDVINANYDCEKCNNEMEFDSTKHYFMFLKDGQTK